MVISRIFPMVFVVCGTFIFSTGARAEVFELAGNGNFVQISQPAWRPEPVVLTDSYAPVVIQPAATVGQSTSQSTGSVRQHIQLAARQYGISSDLIDAVAWQESRYNPRAISSAGAIGVMQLMPGTARNLGVTNPHDVRQNVAGGAAYLREQLDRFGNNVPLALAAYNAGPGAVRKYGGIPPYRETQNYVRKIMQRLSAVSVQRVDY
ncbi:MAG: lytic transglycosylase domain-containing protein [Sphingorhabdus sp.]|uniref:lytic transglycosylase domain-containing protein n=1 Tax=Sphingorhabdus sp. TaxID=1902408 RepID=UPI0038FC9DFB